MKICDVGMRIIGYVKELAPWAAVFATLFGLFYQAKQTRDEKADAKWEQVFTAVANGTAGPADVIVFNRFIGSKEHRDDARFAAKQFLGSGAQNPEVFQRVFNALYSDARSEYFEDWREIDRSLVDTYNSDAAKQPPLTRNSRGLRRR